jgi:zinc transport system substrate-binding protein
MRELSALRVLFRISAVLAALVLATSATLAQDKPRIIAVNYPLQYFAERLLGEAAEVIYPVPEGVDPSFWRPSIAEISSIQSADLILLNGAGFATWTSKVSLPRSKLVDTSRGLEDRLITTESITHSHGDGGEHSHEGIASYTWLDLSLATRQAQAIADALKARALADPAAIDDRMVELANDLAELDTTSHAKLMSARDTVLIATHPRYQYLARAYALKILRLEWEAGAMPGDQDLKDLERLATDNGAKVLIWEAQPPDAAIEAATALGLESVIFPPLAAPPSMTALPESFGASIDALADAVERANSG